MNHRTLYQFLHPFHWLTYGSNNASGVQAATAVVATIAAIVAGYFAGRAYFATVKQVELAKEQLNLAHAQYKTAQQRYAEEKASSLFAKRAEFERTKAEEDALRPRFATGGFSDGIYNLDFTNVGGSPATEVEFLTGITKEVFYRNSIIPSEGTVTVRVSTFDMQTSGIEIRFRTTFGSHWRIMQWIPTNENPNREAVLDVKRIYEPRDLYDQLQLPASTA